MSLPLELKQVFGDAQDDPITPEVADDAFDNFLHEATLAGAYGGRPGAGFGHVEALRAETSGIHTSFASHYKKLAKAEAEKKTPPAPPASNELKKRFSGNEKNIFRKFFAEQRQLGKSISEILDRFTPQARAEFGQILQELCEEFAAAA
jgi:hypothetical protein